MEMTKAERIKDKKDNQKLIRDDNTNGQKLYKANGRFEYAHELLLDENQEVNKDLILYYFSAQWGQPTQKFTPKLKEFYEAVSSLEVKLEIIFISLDESQEKMIAYMKESHGDWLASGNRSQFSKDLNVEFDLEGIPTLIVCKLDRAGTYGQGTLITKEGRKDVLNLSPEQAVDKWMKSYKPPVIEESNKCLIS